MLQLWCKLMVPKNPRYDLSSENTLKQTKAYTCYLQDFCETSWKLWINQWNEVLQDGMSSVFLKWNISCW